MADFNKTEAGRPPAQPQRPPPIPSTKARAPGGALSKVKAFLEIRRLRTAELFRKLGTWLRGHKRAAGLSAAVLVLAVAAALAFAFDAVPDVDLLSPRTLAEARQAARKDPKDADAQRELGHALFAAKQRRAGVVAYRRALALDPGVADGTMIDDLVGAFGTREQDEAEALIWKNGLLGAQKKLEALVSSRSYGVRWGAVQTLDRLKKGTRANWETAYVLDLESSSCDVKRRAVAKLGEIGSQRAVKALRAAKAEDEKTGGWFKGRCLGDRLEEAEKQIIARR